MGDWVEWGGGPRPISRDTVVDVRFACGDEIEGLEAGVWGWSWDGQSEPSDCHIIAYRVGEAH